MPTLYIIPTVISHGEVDHIPPIIRKVIADLDVFIVEKLRTARRYLRSLDREFPIDDTDFIELDKHDSTQHVSQIELIFDSGRSVGLMSESGTPCIADPGSAIVHLARNNGYRIQPLTGPSSIILALMASGLNGQNFVFHGYLPVKEAALARKLREIAVVAQNTGQTQIFIETPYRNEKLVQQIKKNVGGDLYLCVAIDLTGENQSITVAPINKLTLNKIEKLPAIFLIGQAQYF